MWVDWDRVWAGSAARLAEHWQAGRAHLLTEDTVRATLAQVAYPGLKRDIVSLGLVRSVAVRNDRVHVSLSLASPREEVPDQLRQTIRERETKRSIARELARRDR